MKKTIFKMSIFTIALMPFTDADAQEGIQLGVQATPHFTWLMNQDDRDNKDFEYLSTLYGSFGISMQYGFTENTAVGIDGLYSMQGQRYKLFDVEKIKRVDYIKIPVMFIYNQGLSENVKMIYKIGPQMGILANAKLTDKDGNDIVSDQKAAYEDLDFGAAAGLGLGIKVQEKLFFDILVRYDYGFTNAESNDYHLNVNNPTVITNGNGNGGTSRAMTSNMTAGLTLGLRYLFE